jgi:hypothetical protein
VDELESPYETGLQDLAAFVREVMPGLLCDDIREGEMSLDDLAWDGYATSVLSRRGVAADRFEVFTSAQTTTIAVRCDGDGADRAYRLDRRVAHRLALQILFGSLIDASYAG